MKIKKKQEKILSHHLSFDPKDSAEKKLHKQKYKMVITSAIQSFYVLSLFSWKWFCSQ